MPAPVTRPQNIERFRGGMGVGRWLKKLRRSYYRLANDGRDVSPSDLIQSIDTALCGEADDEFVGRNPLLRQIVDQADDFTATVDDLALRSTYLRMPSGSPGPFRCGDGARITMARFQTLSRMMASRWTPTST
ncbi:hypothetical protein E4U49_006633 [Claviceps purpurea]|nr:hypothetical protein E4U49_006633 [Claviceps purpurea]